MKLLLYLLYLAYPQVLPCYLTINTDLSFVRLKPVEQLSPMLGPGDFETKFERKKSQPSQVGTHSDQTIFTKPFINCAVSSQKMSVLFFSVIKNKCPVS